MIRTTPFHERLVQLNDQHLFTHWQGTLSALRYTHAPKHEYFAVRNSVGIFDTSPLYKYRVSGPDAERLLSAVLVRDPATTRPGRAAYTLLCDDEGFVRQDGVAFRHGPEDFLLTTARPALAWLDGQVDAMRVDLADQTDDLGILAVQGPRSREVLRALAPQVDQLAYFEHLTSQICGVPVTVSRTGYTGDLGFELTVPAGAALEVLDSVLAAGVGHGLRPFGEQALDMLRIEAGLALVDIEWRDSRTAWTDHDRVTPTELGMGWMLKGVGNGRHFVGSRAIARELAQGAHRWATVGVEIDWQDWDRLHREAGELPGKDEHPLPYETWLHADPDGPRGADGQVGHTTSLMYSPVLQRHVGIARVRPAHAAPGTPLRLETTLHHATVTVAARTTTLPHFNPDRKTARP